jgi:hypothetical protein
VNVSRRNRVKLAFLHFRTTTTGLQSKSAANAMSQPPIMFHSLTRSEVITLMPLSASFMNSMAISALRPPHLASKVNSCPSHGLSTANNSTAV